MRKVCTFASGKLAEWSNAAVLKTVDCQRSGGSNPSLSADNIKALRNNLGAFFMLEKSDQDQTKQLKRQVLTDNIEIRSTYLAILCIRSVSIRATKYHQHKHSLVMIYSLFKPFIGFLIAALIT